MPNQIQFWFSPSAGTITWFLVGGILLVVTGFLVRFLFHRRVRRRDENIFREKMEEIGLRGQPEEDILRELATANKISPPVNVISNLQSFDQLANDAILKTVVARIPLADRIDRIEYLYSIRLHAFSHEPSVGGLEDLLGIEKAPPPLVMKEGPPKTADIQAAPLEPPLSSDLESDPDFAQLIGDFESLGLPDETPPTREEPETPG